MSVQALYPLFCLNEQTASCRLGVVVKTPQAIKMSPEAIWTDVLRCGQIELSPQAKIKLPSSNFWWLIIRLSCFCCRCVYETKVFLFLTLWFLQSVCLDVCLSVCLFVCFSFLLLSISDNQVHGLSMCPLVSLSLSLAPVYYKFPLPLSLVLAVCIFSIYFVNLNVWDREFHPCQNPIFSTCNHVPRLSGNGYKAS